MITFITSGTSDVLDGPHPIAKGDHIPQIGNLVILKNGVVYKVNNVGFDYINNDVYVHLVIAGE